VQAILIPDLILILIRVLILVFQLIAILIPVLELIRILVQPVLVLQLVFVLVSQDILYAGPGGARRTACLLTAHRTRRFRSAPRATPLTASGKGAGAEQNKERYGRQTDDSIHCQTPIQLNLPLDSSCAEAR
jgi:hypothetical protein